MIEPLRGAARGFSLIELMVVVTVVAVLAAIAYPSYVESVRRGWRAEGKSALLAAAQAQERHFSAQNTYSSNAGGATPDVQSIFRTISGDGASGRYTLATAVTACPTGGGNCAFTISATPQGWADARCGVLAIDNVGTRTQSRGTAAECWDR